MNVDEDGNVDQSVNREHRLLVQLSSPLQTSTAFESLQTLHQSLTPFFINHEQDPQVLKLLHLPQSQDLIPDPKRPLYPTLV